MSTATFYLMSCLHLSSLAILFHVVSSSIFFSPAEIFYSTVKPIAVECPGNISSLPIIHSCEVKVDTLSALSTNYEVNLLIRRLKNFCEYAFIQRNNTFIIRNPQPGLVYFIPCSNTFYRPISYGDPPHLTANLYISNSPVKLGDILHLSCQLSDPRLSSTFIYWYKNNVNIFSNGGKYLTPLANHLIIMSVDESDEGSYHCQIHYFWGDVVSPMVSVLVEDSARQWSLQTIVVKLGQSFTLTANQQDSLDVMGSIKWFRLDEKPVTLGSDPFQAFISRALVSDNVIFICGYHSNVNITNFYSGNSEGFNVTVEVAPRILTSPQYQYSSEEAEIMFHCQHFGIPLPIVDWENPRKETLSSLGLQIYSNYFETLDDGRLKVSHVVSENEGFYTCNVHSSSGQSQVKSHLSIESRQLGCPPILHEIPPKKIEVFLGETVTFKCATSTPNPSQRIGFWRAHATVNQSMEHLTTNTHQMQITKSDSGSSGVYFCILSDFLREPKMEQERKTVYTFSLIVLPIAPPSFSEEVSLFTSYYSRPPTTTVVLVDVTWNSVSIKWREVISKPNSDLYYSIEWCHVKKNGEVSGWEVWHDAWPRAYATIDRLEPDTELRVIVRSRYIPRYSGTRLPSASEWSYPSPQTAWLKTIPKVTQPSSVHGKDDALRFLIVSVTMNRFSQIMELKWRLHHDKHAIHFHRNLVKEITYVLTPVPSRHCLPYFRRQQFCSKGDRLLLETLLLSNADGYLSHGEMKMGNVPMNDPTWLIRELTPNVCYNVSINAFLYLLNNTKYEKSVLGRYAVEINEFERYIFTDGLAPLSEPLNIQANFSIDGKHLQLTWTSSNVIDWSGFAVEIFHQIPINDSNKQTKLVFQKYISTNGSQWEWNLSDSLLQGLLFVRLATRDCQGFFSSWSPFVSISLEKRYLPNDSENTSTTAERNITAELALWRTIWIMFVGLIGMASILFVIFFIICAVYRYKCRQKLHGPSRHSTSIYEISSSMSSNPSSLMKTNARRSPHYRNGRRLNALDEGRSLITMPNLPPPPSETTTNYANSSIMYEIVYTDPQSINSSTIPSIPSLPSDRHEHPSPYAVTFITPEQPPDPSSFPLRRKVSIRDAFGHEVFYPPASGHFSNQSGTDSASDRTGSHRSGSVPKRIR